MVSLQSSFKLHAVVKYYAIKVTIYSLMVVLADSGAIVTDGQQEPI